jgi:hypothetical protein
VHNIQNCAGKPTVAKSALRFSDCSTATSPKGSPRPSADLAAGLEARFLEVGVHSTPDVRSGRLAQKITLAATNLMG